VAAGSSTGNPLALLELPVAAGSDEGQALDDRWRHPTANGARNDRFTVAVHLSFLLCREPCVYSSPSRKQRVSIPMLRIRDE
jgi:hypothetical protein